jgi:3-hydroxy acid dehydrogenase/malonic semialdehyde reductase
MTVLITGASAGIGKATADLLAKEKGMRLILTARRAETLKKVAAALPCETHLLTFDVRDKAATIAAMEGLPDAWRDIDVLVNNAGLALGLEPFDTADTSDWDVMIETNIMGLLTMTRAVLPRMKARGRGHVINISSTAANYHYAGAHVYGASKAFVTYLSLALRSDLLGTPIRVTNIEPGMTDTEFSMVRFKGDNTRASAVYADVEPLHAEDIAETIRWVMAQPAHVNVNRIELMATCQAPAGLKVHRD